MSLPLRGSERLDELEGRIVTTPGADQSRLAELRRQWQQHPDRRAEIEAEAAELTAMHLLRTQLGAEVVEIQPTTERSTTP